MFYAASKYRANKCNFQFLLLLIYSFFVRIMGSDSSKPVQLNDGEMILECPPDGQFRESFQAPTFVKLTELKKSLKSGDIVAVCRDALIDHYMLYIGGDNEVVIHFYASNGSKKATRQSIMDYLSNRILSVDTKADRDGVIALENIDNVVGNDKCAIDNRASQVYWYLDSQELRKVVRTQEKIILEAEKKFQHAVRYGHPKYNLYNYNCETFALELRYGAQIPSFQAHGNFAYRGAAEREYL